MNIRLLHFLILAWIPMQAFSNALYINVVGVPGSGYTEWAFSGGYDVLFDGGRYSDPQTNGYLEPIGIPNAWSVYNSEKRSIDAYPSGVIYDYLPQGYKTGAVNAWYSGLVSNNYDYIKEEALRSRTSFGDPDTLGVSAKSVVIEGSVIITGSKSGVHNLNGLYLDNDGSTGGEFAWYADGTFSEIESYAFSGSGTIPYDITEFGEGSDSINSIGDGFNYSNTGEKWFNQSDLFINFQAIPEPSVYTLFLAIIALIRILKRNFKTYDQ